MQRKAGGQTHYEGEVCLFFCLIIKIFTIIFDVLEHYYDKLCRPQSWSSLLTSLKTTEEHEHSENPLKNTINTRFKRHETY